MTTITKKVSKKLWEKGSFVIVLMGISCFASLIFYIR